jgi:23S rRNA (guanosine2251-2'-O)-methyltransferase
MKILKKYKVKNKGFSEIFGIHAVTSALKNKKRKHLKLVISSNQKELLNSLGQNIKNSIKEIIEISNKDMFKIYGSENNHQGIILVTSNLIQPDLNDMFHTSINKKNEIVIMLDHVSDPNNIGSIMRSCVLFNCKTIVVAKDNSPDITPSMAKSASGALELINYIKVTNLSRAIDGFKKNNFWVYGLDNNESNLSDNKNKFEIPNKCLLILGAEGKGLRDLTKKHCDGLISIPINKNSELNIESLNVSNACSIALYEHFINNN